MFFTHNTQYYLLFLIHVQIQCDLAITSFTCVNVCSLNCLNLVFEIQNWLDLFSVCVCVFWRSLCSKFLDWETILRDYWVDWIIGWVVCWIAFIFVFFSSRKTVLKSWLDTFSMPCYLSSFSSLFLNAISTPPRHLVDRSSFCSWNWFFVARYLLDTSAVDDHFLDTSLDSFLDTSRYLSCRALLKVLFKPPSRFVSHFFDLSRSVCACSSPNHSLFHS